MCEDGRDVLILSLLDIGRKLRGRLPDLHSLAEYSPPTLDRNAVRVASRTFPLSQGRSPPADGGRGRGPLVIDRAREVSQEDDEDTLHSIVAAPQRRRSSVARTHSIAHYERAERLFTLRLRVHPRVHRGLSLSPRRVERYGLNHGLVLSV